MNTPAADATAMEPVPSEGITLGTLLTMSKAQLDDLYLRKAPLRPIEPGEIPTGEASGTAIVAPGTFWAWLMARIARRFFWQGKVFDPETGTLLNSVSIAHLKAVRAKVDPA